MTGIQCGVMTNNETGLTNIISQKNTYLNIPRGQTFPLSRTYSKSARVKIPTFHQLVHTGDLLAAIYGVDRAYPLRQMQVIRQRTRQLHQQGIIRAESVTRHGVHQTLKVPISVTVESDLFGLLLRGERLKGTGAVVAAVGAVGRARNQAAAPGAGA